jgi:hypothetical protein
MARKNIIIMIFTNLDKVQNIELSSALHCTVEPNIPKIPEPIIPPLLGALELLLTRIPFPIL